jgi:CheY-like chemotaxis protein
MYTFVLKRRGFTVHQARDSMEGLRVLEVAKPDAIILDLVMPGENGIEFLQRADLKDKLPHTKVFVVSNVESDEFAKQLEAFKIEKYVTKVQYPPNRIVDMVEDSLGREAGKLRLPWMSRLRRWLGR